MQAQDRSGAWSVVCTAVCALGPGCLDTVAVAVLVGFWAPWLSSSPASHKDAPSLLSLPPALAPCLSSLLSHGLIFLGKPLPLRLYYLLALPINRTAAFSTGFTS